MQSEIDWTTGALRFFDADPPKSENINDFKSDESINKAFDPVPSSYFFHYIVFHSKKESS